MQPHRIFCRIGGAGVLIYNNVWLIGRYTSREHYKEADLWAGRGVKGREAEWVDTANVVWYEVTGLCGFWDGSCESGTCGAGVMIQAFTETLGWALIHKKCGPVLGRNYLDAELCGCGMLMEI